MKPKISGTEPLQNILKYMSKISINTLADDDILGVNVVAEILRLSPVFASILTTDMEIWRLK